MAINIIEKVARELVDSETLPTYHAQKITKIKENRSCGWFAHEMPHWERLGKNFIEREKV